MQLTDALVSQIHEALKHAGEIYDALSRLNAARRDDTWANLPAVHLARVCEVGYERAVKQLMVELGDILILPPTPKAESVDSE